MAKEFWKDSVPFDDYAGIVDNIQTYEDTTQLQNISCQPDVIKTVNRKAYDPNHSVTAH